MYKYSSKCVGENVSAAADSCTSCSMYASLAAQSHRVLLLSHTWQFSHGCVGNVLPFAVALLYT